MSDRTTAYAHETAEVGTAVRSLDPVSGVGTWEAAPHRRCEGTGRLMAIPPGEPAPLCPVCGQEVCWQVVD